MREQRPEHSSPLLVPLLQAKERQESTIVLETLIMLIPRVDW